MRDVTPPLPDPLINARLYGALGDGNSANASANNAAFAASIAAAKALGATGYLGATILLPPGIYDISTPIVLPRTGSTPTNVVALAGSQDRATVIRGTSAFPSGRALIEWEDTPARTQHQSIRDLTFSLPFVAGVRAIHYKLSGTVTTEAGVSAQWFSFNKFERIVIEAQGDYQAGGLIKIEGGCRYTDFVNVWGDPSLGANDVLLFEFDHEVGSSGNAPTIGSDSVGFEFGRIINPVTSARRGGYSRLFKGRMAFASIELGNAHGGRSGNGGYVTHVLNGFRFTIDGLINEGLGEAAQMRFENCRYWRVRDCGLGTPDATDNAWAASTAYNLGDRVAPTSLKGSGLATRNAYYTCTTAGTSGGSEPTWPASGTVSDGTAVWTYGGQAVGDGLQLIASTDGVWDGRHAVGGATPFSRRLVKAATMDASSARNALRRFDVNEATVGSAANEVTLSAGNTAEGYGVNGSLGAETFTAYSVTGA